MKKKKKENYMNNIRPNCIKLSIYPIKFKKKRNKINYNNNKNKKKQKMKKKMM